MRVFQHISLCNFILIVMTTHHCVHTTPDIEKDHTGVIFSPLVKSFSYEEKFSPYIFTYNAAEIKVMLEVILDKFSKVATTTSGAAKGKDIRDVTIYNGSYIIAQTAANINLQRGNRSITVIQGMSATGDDYTLAEVQLAVECAEKANKIYPGTVEGLLFYHQIDSRTPSLTEQTLKYINFLRNSSVAHLRIGVVMFCNDAIIDDDLNEHELKQAEMLRKVLQKSNFVLCDLEADDVSKRGAMEAFQFISYWLIEYRKELPKVNTNLDVMGQLRWSSNGPYDWQNLNDMKLFWETASRWAGKHSFTIWFIEAFDIPWHGYHSEYAHRGWWKLSNNSQAHLKEGYVEKIAERRKWGLPVGVSDTAVATKVNTTAAGIVTTLLIYIINALTHFHQITYGLGVGNS